MLWITPVASLPTCLPLVRALQVKPLIVRIFWNAVTISGLISEAGISPFGMSLVDGGVGVAASADGFISGMGGGVAEVAILGLAGAGKLVK